MLKRYIYIYNLILFCPNLFLRGFGYSYRMFHINPGYKINQISFYFKGHLLIKIIPRYFEENVWDILVYLTTLYYI